MHKVLIVEDDPGIRDTIADLFEMSDYKVEVAVNGAEGYRKLLSKKPDIIVSDIMMPVMDGLQLLRKVREGRDTYLVPFILVTAKVTTESKLKCLEIGADDYLTKPFEIKELLLKVNNLIKRKQDMIEKFASTPGQVIGMSKEELLMQKLKHFLEENLSNARLSLPEVASGLAVSSSTLQKTVKKVSDKSVSQFIREYRLKRAYDLILLSNSSLKEIATNTGFSSLSYFSRSYKELFGNSPSADS